MATASVSNVYANQIPIRDLTKYTLGRGVPDMTQLKQWDMYEKGTFPVLVVLKIPEFMNQLATQNDAYASLIKSFRHTLEYDFQGLDGIEDITSSTQEINTGNTKLEMITNTNWENGNVSMKFQERKGSLFTRFANLYLRGIKDPRSKVKTYDGLLKSADQVSVIDDGYENEVFEFLYFTTDNTARYIENAYLLAACQLQTCQLGEMSNQQKGQIDYVDINLTFSSYQISNPLIDAKAQSFLNWIRENTCFEDNKFGYQSAQNLSSITPDNYGTSVATSPTLTW